MNSKIHELRDYYKRQMYEAVRLMMALPEGVEKRSAEDSVEYFRTQFYRFVALCNGAKP